MRSRFATTKKLISNLKDTVARIGQLTRSLFYFSLHLTHSKQLLCLTKIIQTFTRQKASNKINPRPIGVYFVGGFSFDVHLSCVIVRVRDIPWKKKLEISSPFKHFVIMLVVTACFIIKTPNSLQLGCNRWLILKNVGSRHAAPPPVYSTMYSRIYTPYYTPTSVQLIRTTPTLWLQTAILLAKLISLECATTGYTNFHSSIHL